MVKGLTKIKGKKNSYLKKLYENLKKQIFNYIFFLKMQFKKEK